MKFALVVVNYNNKKLTEDCVLSFLKEFEKISVFVVDNSTIKNQLFNNTNISFTNNQSVEVIIPGNNIGYFPAINYCLNIIKNKNFDYYLVGNNDVLCHSNWTTVFENKKEIIDKYPVISPRIINEDGFDQNPMIPKSYTLFHLIRLVIHNINYRLSKLLLKIVTVLKIYKKNYKLQSQNNVEGEIAIGFGAFYILTKDFFNNKINIPQDSFLMGEEQFLYINLKRAKKRFYYLPSLILFHREHSSVSLIPDKFLWSLNKKAFWKYIWKMPIRFY